MAHVALIELKRLPDPEESDETDVFAGMKQERRSYNKVCFFTSSIVLRNQLKTDIQGLFEDINDMLEFCSVETVESREEIGEHAVYIVDEADLTAEHYITLNDKGNLNGLYNLLKAGKVYFFSATMPAYFKQLFKATLGEVSDRSWKSQYQLTNDTSEPYEIKDFLCSSNKEMYS
jgi:hypothetical protein